MSTCNACRGTFGWLVAGMLAAANTVCGQPAEPAVDALRIVAPEDGSTTESFLTAILRWQYTLRADLQPIINIRLRVSEQPDLDEPIVDVDLRDHQTSYRLAVVPGTTYYWEIVPVNATPQGKQFDTSRAARAKFTAGLPRNDFAAPDEMRYRNPRAGAHWQMEMPFAAEQLEPLSPWYALKSYHTSPPPKLADVRDRLPVPVWDGHPEALDAYWFCWDTILHVWTFAPQADDHQAVSNIIGYPTWAFWGSTMVWDTCFMLHFARYGAQAYPFITGLDNCYARQHENGFICRESDRENREVYVIFPVNPPLFAWAEWEQYRVSGDQERLARVLLPIIKQYEWWMRYQRRENGLYWTSGMNEADDSPRNSLMHYAVSASSYQALAALHLAMIARELNRPDVATFFDAQHRELATLVNAHFWDAAHHMYNDIAPDGRFITELRPGVFCKHVHAFWPLIAELVPPDHVPGLVQEITNPASFNRPSGIASLSADSDQFNKEDGQYWKGAVWPPTQCMVQEGLRKVGRWDVLLPLADNYYAACLAAYQGDKNIRENLMPDRPVGCGAGDFVGWGGIGPVANLIEYILGLDIDAPNRRITWRIRQAERHGLCNLQFLSQRVDLVCDARPNAEAPCRVHVKSGVAFTLRVQNGLSSTPMDLAVAAGEQTIELPGAK